MTPSHLIRAPWRLPTGAAVVTDPGALAVQLLLWDGLGNDSDLIPWQASSNSPTMTSDRAPVTGSRAHPGPMPWNADPVTGQHECRVEAFPGLILPRGWVGSSSPSRPLTLQTAYASG